MLIFSGFSIVLTVRMGVGASKILTCRAGDRGDSCCLRGVFNEEDTVALVLWAAWTPPHLGRRRTLPLTLGARVWVSRLRGRQPAQAISPQRRVSGR